MLNESRSIIDPPPPKRALTTRGRDFMELWQARCVQGYIAAHLHSKIRTGDLARVTQFKRSKFNRIFKASFGCTPCQYVKRMRVARAQNLMIISSSPLSQIALECGFADQAHFSNCFRRVVGERPAAWRAQRCVSSEAWQMAKPKSGGSYQPAALPSVGAVGYAAHHRGFARQAAT